MKTDSLFYRLFQEFPDIFFELIGSTPEVANNYQFSSVEVKQTAFRIDGVFLPNLESNRIYFVEVQFQPQQEFYLRFLAEIFLYLRQNKPENDWSAIVLYPSSSTDAANIKHYQEFFDSGRIRRIYLNELRGEVFDNSIAIRTVKLIVAPESKTVEQARDLVKRVRQQSGQLQQEKFIQLIETILSTGQKM
ncbi:MAG: Rpn family recombination-promoting nuclease/putative transposase [Chroococcus sp. CMT-3BRIN-NPC107]|nr:Rpn family recombination-promoting nuclease/putative transposase [Chroococcus sp. CMT-3BRIN-NPC107]